MGVLIAWTRVMGQRPALVAYQATGDTIASLSVLVHCPNNGFIESDTTRTDEDTNS